MKRDIKDIWVATALILVGLVALLVLMTAFTFGIGQWIRETAGFTGKTAQIRQTKGSGSFRIASYDHFFDLCASVQDQEVTIVSQQSELSDPATTSDRKAQIRANLSALRANRGELINHYNADARKTATSGQFRASDLPFQIDPTQEHTSCTA